MRRILAGAALASGVPTSVIALGVGLFLAGVEQSGERGAGLVLAGVGAGALAALLVLVFAPAAWFARRGGGGLAAATAVIAVLPPVGLGAAALAFAGVPVGSVVPRLDWTLFVLGLALVVGALAMAGLAYLRGKAGAPIEAEHPDSWLYAPLAADTARGAVEIDRHAIEIDENVRVKRV